MLEMVSQSKPSSKFLLLRNPSSFFDGRKFQGEYFAFSRMLPSLPEKFSFFFSRTSH
uniref:Uncharacterized protein n=1 Tax=Arundo donax TaxID=35708 RepID=A0A0A9BQH1_ARUDO